jgi:glutaredoxin-like protein
MAMLNAEIQGQVRDLFEALDAPVKLVVFTQGEGGALECEMCRETRELLEEVAALSDKLSVEVRDFVAEAETAAAYGIDKIPAVAIVRGGENGAPDKDYGIRLYGIPSGYEFGTLIEDITMVSSGDPGLAPKTLAALESLPGPIDIQVFVTPTCPHCPRAVLLGHRLAMASDKIRAAMVEATEFPHLAGKYQVYGVPRTVVNDVIHVEGAVPESMLLDKLAVLADASAMQRLRLQWEKNVN